ncbi:MAG: DUF4920 domain-containing protein [Rheinheimera sp.]|nr:DUF4920 domain-containing protein [Rheinheimera sp.]
MRYERDHIRKGGEDGEGGGGGRGGEGGGGAWHRHHNIHHEKNYEKNRHLRPCTFAKASVYPSSVAFRQNFGPKFDASNSVTVQQVLAKPTEFLAKPFTVQGKIDAVCQKKGCWMQFETAADQPTFRLKVKDGDMVFPVSAKGKNAYAYGSLKAKPMSLEQTKTYLKHRAEEQGEVFDPQRSPLP